MIYVECGEDFFEHFFDLAPLRLRSTCTQKARNYTSLAGTIRNDQPHRPPRRSTSRTGGVSLRCDAQQCPTRAISVSLPLG